MKKIFVIALSLFLFLLAASPSLAAVTLVKTKNSPAVYFLNGEKSRHIFPNELTYKSWYGNDFSKIVTVSDDWLSKIPLGKNITVRSGKYLAKIQSDPKIYAVEPGGVLRHIQEAGVAEEIYGKNWEKKVIDIPEAFFDNYMIGKPVKNSSDIPNGILYKVKNGKTYYWKIDNIVWPFESEKAIIDNGYSLDDTVVGERTYYVRQKSVAGKNEGVSNPISEPRTKNTDCENKNLKAAFIFIPKNTQTYDEMEKIQKIKSGFEEYFSWATRDLSKIDTTYPTTILKDEGFFTKKNEKGEITLAQEEIAYTFLENNPDVFDFLVVFGNFKILDKEQAYFTPVTNRVYGIGKYILEGGEVYGSRGKLKGIIVMNDINSYDTQNPKIMTHVMNLLTHEILHQWSGSVQFLDENKKHSEDLLQKPDLAHWSFYAGFISPLGGGGWQDNKNGTFTSMTSQMENSQKKPLSDLDLYLMGVLPYQVIQPFYYIIPDNPDALGNTIAAKAQSVSIQQIIDANGKWLCILE